MAYPESHYGTSNSKRGRGSSASSSTSSTSARERYWSNASGWEGLLSAMEHTQRFISIFQSPKIAALVQHLNTNFVSDQDKLLIISPFNQIPFDLNLFSLNFSIPVGPDKAKIKYRGDPGIFGPISHLLPIYEIEDPADPIPSRCCDSLSNYAPLLKDDDPEIHCTSCGIRICAICVQKIPVFHLGCNSPVPLCSPCVGKVQGTNALIWIKQAKIALNNEELKGARLMLDVAHAYMSNVERDSPQFKALKEIEELATSTQDYKTKIMSLSYLGVHGFQWGSEALKMAAKNEVQMFSYALACLKLINVRSTQENEQKWEALGERLFPISPELGRFCYFQCSTFTSEKWLEKAKHFDKLELHSAAYHCLLQVRKRDILSHADQLFSEKRHRLGLCLLKVGGVKGADLVPLLRRWYVNKSEGENAVVTVIAIIKYIHNLDHESVSSFSEKDPVLLIARQLFKMHDMEVESIIEELDKLYQRERMLIPLSLLKRKSSLSWGKLKQKAITNGLMHSSRIFNVLAELGSSDEREEVNTEEEKVFETNSAQFNVERESWIEEIFDESTSSRSRSQHQASPASEEASECASSERTTDSSWTGESSRTDSNFDEESQILEDLLREHELMELFIMRTLGRCRQHQYANYYA